ncbi:zonadhesin [Caerostris extrusa]|uniref:Zonadhesin n=1 Tax=Caerostris extrusa TaxID=172846 RepID=A0AAV4MAP7_CAEEX|nr:zonadhesin [Caerostris extrusa]
MIVCGINEEFQECGTACPIDCNNMLNPPVCRSPCVKGCFCKMGFVKDPTGKCVPPELCPIPDAINLPVQKGCFCSPGFVRDKQGNCILPKLCPPICGENEEFKECGTACPVTCLNRNQQIKCQERCVKGCFCKDGFVRNPSGKCCLPKLCQLVMCGENEEFRRMWNVVSNNLCQSKSAKFMSRKMCKGCFCRDGFVRDPTGKCVLPRFLSGLLYQLNVPFAVCGENEEFKECGTSCPTTCANRIQRNVCLERCAKGCFCRDGFVRDPTGKCVLPRFCPVVCGENEEFKECGTACPVTCVNRNQLIKCQERCVKGCFCKDGFVRNPSGKCCLPQLCPVVCGENEEFKECGTACPLTCVNRNQQIKCLERCVKGCFCKDGFVRDLVANVVHPNFSVAKMKNSKNVERRVQQLVPIKISEIYVKKDVQKGCFCRDGFVRDPIGKCVLPRFCPVICGENEEFRECGTSCPTTCVNRNQRNLCQERCAKGCFCRDGFVRDPTGKCVLPRFCPVICGENEEFKECGTACPLTCVNRNQQIKCQERCVKGCFCKDGFVRDPSGKCCLPQLCPVVCGENEEFKECGTACPLTCVNRNQQIKCQERCVKGCFCKNGFVRDPSSKCCLPEFCPVVCGENEEFKNCGTACPTVLIEISETTLCQERCVKGCFCREGFIKDPSGKCVLPQFCPVLCGENEEFKKECGTSCPTTCVNRNQRTLCQERCVKVVLQRWFRKRPNRKCVLPQLCPVICGENEEFKECGTACPLTCVNRNQPIKCQERCVKGCFCKDGFVRDPSGKCCLLYFVSWENEEFKECGTSCPTTCDSRNQRTLFCGENEEFKQCGTACPATCLNRNTKILCQEKCVRGCFCRDSFIRDSSGKCVLPRFCQLVICGENEEFKECGTACPATCVNRNKKILCQEKCIRGCFCRDGFVRDPSGKCCPPEQCPVVCKANEEFKECGPPCPANCTHPVPIISDKIAVSVSEDAFAKPA